VPLGRPKATKSNSLTCKERWFSLRVKGTNRFSGDIHFQPGAFFNDA
jgi:hypothetical protein